MNRVNNDNFIVIPGWMVTELGLKGNELLIYAIIYGFSQAEDQAFSGSLQYLADWTNSTKQGVMKCLKSLIEKGHIEKDERQINNVKFCEYYATKFNGGIKQSLTGYATKFNGGIKQSLTGYATKFNGGIKQSLPNNIINNIEDNINNNIVGATAKRFSPPTPEEVKEYCKARRNNVDADRFVDYYQARGWYLTKGRKMVDWRAAVRTWECGDKKIVYEDDGLDEIF